MEGQIITAGDTDLIVLSVSIAVADIAQHQGLAAIEGGVIDIADDGRSLELSCVSQVL